LLKGLCDGQTQGRPGHGTQESPPTQSVGAPGTPQGVGEAGTPEGGTKTGPHAQGTRGAGAESGRPAKGPEADSQTGLAQEQRPESIGP
jgi:hypothetical protein